MRYQLIIIILSFFLLFLSFSISEILAEWKIPTPTSSNNFLDYENPDVGYNIKYPDNWIKLESKNNTIFYPPLEENRSTQNLSIYLTITNTSLPDIPLSLESIVDETITNLNSTLGKFNLKGSQLFLLNDGNSLAHKLVYSYVQSNKIINNMDIGLIANKNLFTLSFVSSSDKYNKYLPTIEKMVETFEIYLSDDNTKQDLLDPEMFLNKLLSPSTINASALGDDQAKITIVEFADYQCPFCAQFNKETKDSVIENFVNTGKAKFLYKDLIVNDGSDKASTLAAAASYCAAEQGMYWEYHDELFKNSKGENTGWVTKNNLKQFANNTRVPDLMKFSNCVDSGKYNEVVSENDAFARNIGLQSTPSFIFYNGTTPVAIQGAQPYEAFEQIIKAIE